MKKVPDIHSKEAKDFCVMWDEGTHIDKLRICNIKGISYQQGKDFRSAYKINELPIDEKQVPDFGWEEQLKRMADMDELVAYHMKYPIEVTIKIETKQPIAVPMTADWHLGAPGVDYDSFVKDVKFMRDTDGIRPLIGGDGYHNIIQASKVGSGMNQSPICVQKAVYYNVLKELKEKILAISTGNHNYWTAMAEGEDWDGELARRLKVVYLKHFAMINLVVGDYPYPILRIHKSRFNSSFNLTHNCKQNQRVYYPDARIVVVEHNHTAAIEQYRYNENECVAIRTGTYDVYDDYAMQNGFFGSYVCNPTVVLFPDKDKIVGFKDMQDAAIYLKAVR